MPSMQLFCHFEVQNISAVLKKKKKRKKTNKLERRKNKLRTKLSGVRDINQLLVKSAG